MLDAPVRPEWNRATSEPRPTSIDLAELREHGLFEGLDEGAVLALLDACRGIQYSGGSFIVRAGGRPNGLQLVYRGLVDLAHINGEHECGVLLLSAKDLLLPASTLFGEPSLVAARALTATKLAVFDDEIVISVMNRSSAFAKNILKAMSGQWRMAVRTVLDQNCRSAAQRVATFLLRLVDLQRDTAAPVLPIAKRHLAARLGMTAETLSRTLQVVATNGVYLRGRNIIVHDRALAEKLAGPDPYPGRDEHMLNVFAL